MIQQSGHPTEGFYIIGKYEALSYDTKKAPNPSKGTRRSSGGTTLINSQKLTVLLPYFTNAKARVLLLTGSSGAGSIPPSRKSLTLDFFSVDPFVCTIPFIAILSLEKILAEAYLFVNP